jgi:hypothetical protein
MTPTAGAEPTDLPVGELSRSGGEPAVPGRPGSWCYDGACVDIPDASKASLPLFTVDNDGDRLTFELPGTQPFTYWSVSYSSDADAARTELASGGTYFDADLSASSPGPWVSSFEFDPPPSGDWMLGVSLQMGDRGDAAYSWHVVVQ